MTSNLIETATKAYKLGQAHMYLRKVEKIFIELNIGTEKTMTDLIHLLEYCNARCTELKEKP